MLSDWLLALGLLFSMQAQLRLAGGVVGFGEIALVAWAGLTALRLLRSGMGWPRNVAFGRITTFWAVFLTAEAVGAATAEAIDYPRDWALVAHDVAAYPLMIAVSALALAQPDAAVRLRRVCRILVGVGVSMAVAQTASAFGAFSIPGIDPWFWDRMRGWTANPNQLALLCAALALMGAHLVETAPTVTQRVAFAAGACAAIAIGALAKTNAFALTLAGGFALALGLRALALLRSSAQMAPARAALVWAMAMFAPVAAGGAFAFVSAGGLGSRGAAALARDSGKDTGDEAALRFHLWRSALDRVVESAFLGLGPGPHLPIPPVMLEAHENVPDRPVNLSFPKGGGPPNYEVHNTFLELFQQTGLVGAVAFVTLLALAFARAVRARMFALAALLVGVMLFGSFHVVLRHPLVWFIVAACLGCDARAPAARLSVRPTS